MRDLTLSCINAFLLSMVLISMFQRLAVPLGLIDVPTVRKNHNGHIPLVGLAVFSAFAISALLLKEQPEGFASFLTGLALLVVVGALDDAFDIRPLIKLLAQIACAVMMLLPGETMIWNLGAIFGDGPVELHLFAVPVTIIAVVGLVNAVNMIDGVDGLAGSLSLTALMWFAIAASILSLDPELSIALVAGCCIVAFLGFNLRHPWRARAIVFLGDSGSMMLGAVLGFLAIRLSQHSAGPSLSPAAALWICAIPVIDTLSLAIRRIAAGRSPFSSDRQHLHHLLLDAGLSVGQVVATLGTIAAFLGAIGLGGWYAGVPDAILLLGLTGPVAVHIWFVRYGRTHLGATWNAIGRSKSVLSRPEPLLK
ncbi:MraY family glycosyltransferase [Dongia deserti]|uniref:MraY family glycosyltransferase n=1 Tax=Dongia deserti TaxID=2268030 RepID=UPI000E65EABE|nr:MraY family glycosyltransferase [Dongia deserti]